MPAIGKEIERPQSFDQIAVREVDNYIEKMEKKAENPVQDQQTPPQQVQPPQTPTPQADMGKVVALQNAAVAKAKIVLPMNREEIEGGMKSKVVDSVRWLAEWCVMMIKKYPGRVFYMPPTQPQV